ncbi:MULTISPECIES: hypothetical protein [Actibacterium]|uniref:Uncharacterized protein n=1 Tax=Actibacterium naphthalenivorans TaxID=1614693 RepID=A0A840CK80_9RHOB|nr:MULTISPECIES: hypothetical protein [Actibacterium]ALG91138.1 hypothetical protein TQ29_14260 [Actibacterium sp. EMB200-NS6]MBB4022487.1 hypothetical protein [Actibacterium naphthalenivorans]
MQDRWHIIREDGALTLARHLPPRFDVMAQTAMPLARKGRLAQQIRQDLWRALRRLRGFTPVVRVEEDGAHLLVRAGGEIRARTFPRAQTQATIEAVLNCPANRARWLANARREAAADA